MKRRDFIGTLAALPIVGRLLVDQKGREPKGDFRKSIVGDVRIQYFDGKKWLEVKKVKAKVMAIPDDWEPMPSINRNPRFVRP